MDLSDQLRNPHGAVVFHFNPLLSSLHGNYQLSSRLVDFP